MGFTTKAPMCSNCKFCVQEETKKVKRQDGKWGSIHITYVCEIGEFATRPSYSCKFHAPRRVKTLK